MISETYLSGTAENPDSTGIEVPAGGKVEVYDAKEDSDGQPPFEQETAGCDADGATGSYDVTFS